MQNAVALITALGGVAGLIVALARFTATARYAAAAERCLSLAKELPRESPARRALLRSAEWHAARLVARRMVYNEFTVSAVGYTFFGAVLLVSAWQVVVDPDASFMALRMLAYLAGSLVITGALIWDAEQTRRQRALVVENILRGDGHLLADLDTDGFVNRKAIRAQRKWARMKRRRVRPPTP